MFTFDGWVTRVAFELHWALETRLHASALNSELDTDGEVSFWGLGSCMVMSLGLSFGYLILCSVL